MKDIRNSIKVKLPPDFLTNHSDRKTAAQIFQNAGVPDDVIIGITGHKSVQGICAYKQVNEQYLATMNILIHAIESKSSSTINLSSILNDSINTTNIHVNIINSTSEFSSDVSDNIQKKLSNFHNCHYSNVTLYFKL